MLVEIEIWSSWVSVGGWDPSSMDPIDEWVRNWCRLCSLCRAAERRKFAPCLSCTELYRRSAASSYSSGKRRNAREESFYSSRVVGVLYARSMHTICIVRIYLYMYT